MKPEMVASGRNNKGVRGRAGLPPGDQGDGHASMRPLNWRCRSTLRPTLKNKGRLAMPIVTWDHVHIRSPDPEATAAWLENILGGVIVRGPGRIDVKLGGANVFIGPIAAGHGFNSPPTTPYQSSIKVQAGP